MSRQDVLRAVAQSVPALTPSVLVAIDGVDGSGKTTFAGALVDALRDGGRDARSVHADDFLHLRAVRHRRGRDSPDGFWLDSYDLGALRRLVLEPVRRDPDDPRNRRYVEGQRLSLAACDPERRADLVIDDTDVDRPAVLEA